MRFLNLLGVALVCMTLAWGPRAWAQAPDTGVEVKSVPVITLTFPGGTLEEYVQAVRKAASGANIMVATGEAGKVHVPPVELESVTVRAAVHLLVGRYDLDDRMAIYVEVEDVRSAGKPVFRVSANKHGGRTQAEVKVWSVLDLIGDELAGDKMSAKEVLTAVETAVELLIEHNQPAQVRFHESTGLLIARGTSSQLHAIGQVVSELRGSLVVLEVLHGLKRAGDAQALIAELEADAEENSEDIWDLMAEREALLKQRKTLEQEANGLREKIRRRDERIRELEERLTRETKE